jgi:hypothetical protein
MLFERLPAGTSTALNTNSRSISDEIELEHVGVPRDLSRILGIIDELNLFWGHV